MRMVPRKGENVGVVANSSVGTRLSAASENQPAHCVWGGILISTNFSFLYS